MPSRTPDDNCYMSTSREYVVCVRIACESTAADETQNHYHHAYQDHAAVGCLLNWGAFHRRPYSDVSTAAATS